VLRINARIPLKGAARIRQALPFALEEQLAGDIDQQHFAFRAKDDAGRTPVAVVEKQLLQEWIDRLDAAGLMPNAIYADSDALPSSPATITLLIEGDRALIRSDEGEVTAFDEGSLETVLELLLDAQAQKLENDATAVPVNLLVYCSDEARQRYEQLWDRQRMRVENLELKILPNGALPLLAGEIAQRAGVNLLQGNFAPKSELPIKWQDWRLAATLLAGFLVLNLAYKGAQLWQLNRADSALDAAALEVFQRAFPAAGEVNDPWNELRSRLGTEDGDSRAPEQTDLSESLEALSAAFAQTPGIRMETLSFRGGELDLQLTAPDVAALDRLRQLISEAGKFTAEIQSANPDEDLIKGRIQITAAGDS
jgi:general secretion pathway protein L